MKQDGCFLFTTNNTSLRNLLQTMPFEELVELTEEIALSLSPGEALNYDINRFCQQYNDMNGRINFIAALVNDTVIAPLQIPLSARHSEAIEPLMKPPLYTLLNTSGGGGRAAAAQEVLTDAVEGTDKKVAITNPRWKPIKEGAPTDKTMVGATIKLLADVKNYPDNAPVTFEIFDCTTQPVFRIGSVRGKNEGGTGTAEWKVNDPNKHGAELKLEFDGEIRSKKSERVPVEVEVIVTGGIHLSLENQNGMQLKGVEVAVLADGEEIYTGSADKGEIALSEIPYTELLGEFVFEGVTVTKNLNWNGGTPPYTTEVVVITTQADTGEAT